jgi:hypothetical protein
MRKLPPTGGIPWPTFDEAFVISSIVDSSIEFRTYYSAERVGIPGSVYWARDDSLPPGIDYRSTTLPAGQQVIRLRRVPAVPSDALKIAHELHHLVLIAQGFPSTGGPVGSETVSSSLNSMLHDPLVNRALRQYGFDLMHDYRTEVRSTLRQLRKQPREPQHHLGRVHWMLNYVGKALEWKVASADSDAHTDPFRPYFDARYPRLAKEARDLLALVQTLGYDTPAAQSSLFEAIIHTFHLAGTVFL